jgi:hypothetical protein
VLPVSAVKKHCLHGKQHGGNKERARSCRSPSADLELTLGTHPVVADYTSSRGSAVSIEVVVRAANHGPARAVGALMTVSYPRRYVRPESEVFTGALCSDSVPTAAWAMLICPIGSIASGTRRAVRLAFDLGLGVLRNVKIGFTVLSLTRDERLGNNFAHATPGFVGCAPSYPSICVPPPPPALRCADIASRNFRVNYTVAAPDPQGFDGDHNGMGCES